MLSVTDHEPGHAAADADACAGDEAGLVGAEGQPHFREFSGVPNRPAGLVLRVQNAGLKEGDSSPNSSISSCTCALVAGMASARTRRNSSTSSSVL